ncbi:MAG: DUF72 domain-containing protein [Actinomycetota bacterium]|nr:DUF72 domain-containing protein [Actinomycetota bacterium]
MARHLYAGTSGFAFKEWKGTFYPEDLSDRKMLEHYSRRLGSVEINYTFRRMPSESTLQTWREQTPDEFRFTLKAPQRITHFKKLVDAGSDVSEFVRRGLILGDRLGTILFQLPPTLRFDRKTLVNFLESLPPKIRYCMEFRHKSWKDGEVLDLLSEHSVALCGADTDDEPLDSIPVTAPHCYLRLRKQEYGQDELDLWAGRVGGVLSAGRDVYCYFKHEGGGVGPKYALRVLEKVKGYKPVAATAG